MLPRTGCPGLPSRTSPARGPSLARVLLAPALLVAFLGGGLQPLVAQNLPGGRGAFQVGFQSPELGSLNEQLAAAGYPAFDDGFLTLGGFGWGRVGRFLVGGEGHGILPAEETTDDGSYRTRLSGGYGLFNLGYLAHSGRRVDLYPIAGIGGGAMTLDVVERSSPTFDDVLDDPGRSSRLSASTFLVSAALGVDVRLGRRHARRGDRDGDDEPGGGLLVGIRTGWIWAPGDANWELDELNDVAGGPQLGPDGFFVRISLGGWGG